MVFKTTQWNVEMSELNREYFLITEASNREGIPALTPDKNTQDRDFRFARQPVGSAPLFFYNGFKERHAKRGIGPMRKLPAILFEGNNLLVPDTVREHLLELDIPGLCIHPAVYMHDDGNWYEGYWYLAFDRRFDCWDRTKSVYDKSTPPIRLGGYELEEVTHYSLNEELILKTPMKERLFFQMGGTTDPFFVCHRSLFRLFHSTDGIVDMITLADY